MDRGRRGEVREGTVCLRGWIWRGKDKTQNLACGRGEGDGGIETIADHEWIERGVI